LINPIVILEEDVMLSRPSQATLAAVARTRPLLERKRAALQRAIGRYMAGLAPLDDIETRNRAEAAGQLLFDWLLDNAPGSGSVRAVGSGMAGRAAMERLDAQDYTRFGDGLAAVLKDELGHEPGRGATPALLWAWGDAYWTLMRAAQPRALALAA